MNYTELEKNSAPLLLELFEKREIETVAFDIDSTVLDTGKHFHGIRYPLIVDVASMLLEDIPPALFEEMIIQFEAEVLRAYYENNRKPVLIGEQYGNALKKYLRYLGLGEITDEIKETISYYEWECYNTSPKEYGGTKEILELTMSAGKNVVFNSHAQDDWTNIKVRYISEVMGSEEQFPYVAVPIDETKDSESWLRAYSKVSSKPENTLTVGDNFNSDIISAIKAGCKNVVWINRRGSKIPQDFGLAEDTYLFIIEDIAQLKGLNVDSRYPLTNPSKYCVRRLI